VRPSILRQYDQPLQFESTAIHDNFPFSGPKIMKKKIHREHDAQKISRRQRFSVNFLLLEMRKRPL
jgi:hypothetical protein